MKSDASQPVTLQLFRDLFTIFYEPLIRVYKSANVYNSVTDFASFADDAIHVVERAQRQDVSADPNQTVQSFIDLCARHENNFYKFVHEVHIHDNGLFTQIMGWLEGILGFLRQGPKGGKLDMNALFQGAVDMKQIDKDKAVAEIDTLIQWQQDRKRWHQDKTRQKMAADTVNGSSLETNPSGNAFKSSDFGLDAVRAVLSLSLSLSFPLRPPLFLTPSPTNRLTSSFFLQSDLQDLKYESSDTEDEDSGDEDLDPIAAERRRRAKRANHLRRTAGEPVKPPVSEVLKLKAGFNAMLRQVLAE